MGNGNDPFAALRYKDFRVYFSIRFLFTFAAQVQTTVLGFYLYQLTHSKVVLAFIGLSEVIPAIGIALYGGYIADKYEKRKILLIVYSGYLLTTLLLFMVTFHTLEGRWLLVVYGLLFCNGISRAFYEPATFSIYAHSVPRELYPNASNWSHLSWQTAFIIGPVAGGFIYAYAPGLFAGATGISVTLITTFFLYLFSMVLVYKLRQYPAVPGESGNPRESLLEGIRFVFNNKLMLYTMSLDLFSVFFGGVTALLPVYALDILKVGAEGLGILRMASSLGAALMMLVLVRWTPMAKPWRNLLIAVMGFGGSIIGFGLSHYYLLSLAFLFVQGAFDSVSVVIRGTLLQLLTPDRMRGRVSAVNSMFISSSAEIGDFESGMAAKLLGTVPAVLFGGSMTLLIVVFTYFKTRKLLSLSLWDIQVADQPVDQPVGHGVEEGETGGREPAAC